MTKMEVLNRAMKLATKDAIGAEGTLTKTESKEYQKLLKIIRDNDWEEDFWEM